MPKTDLLFQLTLIDLEKVVQIFDLAMLCFFGAFAFRFQLRNGGAICWCLVSVDRMGLSPVFQASHGFAQKPLLRLIIACG